MFHSIRASVLSRMQALEQIDAEDREDGTPRLERLRQIAPDTGKFLALLAASAPAGEWLEIGTDYYMQDKYDDAMKAFEKALEVNPYSAKAYVGLGSTFFKLGKYQETVDALNRAIQIE